MGFCEGGGCSVGTTLEARLIVIASAQLPIDVIRTLHPHSSGWEAGAP